MVPTAPPASLASLASSSHSPHSSVSRPMPVLHTGSPSDAAAAIRTLAPTPLSSGQSGTATSLKRKATDSAMVAAPEHASRQPTLNNYFNISLSANLPSSGKAPKSRRLDITPGSEPGPVADIDAEMSSNSCTGTSVSSTTTNAPPDGPPSRPHNFGVRRVHCITGETRSQQFFSISTGIPPESLTIRSQDGFYLFMNMRAEFGWISYQMTPRKWVEATNEYSRRLLLKLGPITATKNPQALLHFLDRMGSRLIERIAKDSYKCKSK